MTSLNLDKALRQKDLYKFQRFIPKEGLVRVHPGITYKDANDVSEDIRWDNRHYIVENPIWNKLVQLSKLIDKGSQVGRRYCVYCYRGEGLIGRIILTEILDNPDGYGKNDFLYNKMIYPEFEHSHWSRSVSGDIFHVTFESGLANNLYAYIPKAEHPKDSNFFYDLIDKTLPCFPKTLPGDGPDTQKYIIVKKIYPSHVLVEYNGEIYRSMNQYDYMKKVNPKRTDDRVNRALRAMDSFADKVKVACGNPTL